MLYLKENVTEQQLKKYGFKKCKMPYQRLYYLCIARGVKVIYIGNGIFIQEWKEDDPRIHSRANCKYRSQDTYLDVLYFMIADSLIESR